jgi:hypothetical protein
VYFRGETIELTIKVQNASSRPITGYFNLSPVWGDSVLSHRYADGPYANVECLLAPFAHDPEQRTSLQRGEEKTVVVSVAVSDAPGCEPARGAFLLDDLGQHYLRVAFHDTSGDDPNGFLESNELAMRVVPAPGREEAAQAAYTPAFAWVSQFRWGADYATEKAVRDIAAFLDRFPESRYAGPLRAGLRRALDFKIRRQKATSAERAIYDRYFAR